MFSLTGILSYRQLREGQFQISDSIRETEGGKEYLNLKIIPAFDFPQSIHRIAEDSSFLLKPQRGSDTSSPPARDAEAFLSGSENYYYLPTEDTAIHKSVGEFVDPSHRKKATKKNCYIKKDCDYVETPSKTAGGFLKRNITKRQLIWKSPTPLAPDTQMPAGNSCSCILHSLFLKKAKGNFLPLPLFSDS